MIRYLIIIFFVFTSCVNEGSYLGNDIRLFKREAWQLAKAVESEDVDEIRRVVKKGKIPIDYQEKRFGQTLLMWSVKTNRYKSAKALLELGADPNLQDNYTKVSAIIYAAEKFETSAFIELLLEFGGNPNSVSERCLLYSCTPLIVASHTRLESVKLLVEAGADINFRTEDGFTALSAAASHSRIDIVYYLMIEKGAEFKRPVGTTIAEKDIFIAERLRSCMFPLDSEKYKTKMKIVDYMLEHGVNYWETYIPENYYQNYDSAYLKLY